jgi:Protein of unknown function (DUF551)
MIESTGPRELYLKGFADGAESLTHWIKCIDQLPSHKEKVLVFNGEIYLATIIKSPDSIEWHSQSSPSGYWNLYNVTHWMPVPNPPNDVK